MAFIRLVGCTVGKKICTSCDTDFDRTYTWRGGGEMDVDDIFGWAMPYHHLCITGGEPFNHDLVPLLGRASGRMMIHIESSGTVQLSSDLCEAISHYSDIWLTISPKPGWREENIELARELKVIVEGLGNGEGWPTLDDAVRWSRYKPTFLQPRNTRDDVNMKALRRAEELVLENPSLRLSVQLHKFLGAR
jgi:organic radical activating enzyme